MRAVSGHIYWVLELAVQPGQADALKALTKEMAEATKANEPGTLGYEFSIAADGTLHVFECYKDSAAAMVHLGNFGKNFAKRFMPMVKPVRFAVYGTPSDEVKGAIAGLGPVYYSATTGFVR
jgi:quinol monooxygenase YgiN